MHLAAHIIYRNTDVATYRHVIPQPRSQGLSSYRLGGKMRGPGNEVGYSLSAPIMRTWGAYP